MPSVSPRSQLTLYELKLVSGPAEVLRWNPTSPEDLLDILPANQIPITFPHRHPRPWPAHCILVDPHPEWKQTSPKIYSRGWTARPLPYLVPRSRDFRWLSNLAVPNKWSLKPLRALSPSNHGINTPLPPAFCKAPQGSVQISATCWEFPSSGFSGIPPDTTPQPESCFCRTRFTAGLLLIPRHS